MVMLSEKQQDVVRCARITLALSLNLSLSWLLNTTIFAAFDPVFPEGRDISMVILAAIGLGATVAATRRPSLFAEKAATPLFMGLFLAGVALSLWGISVGSPVLVTTGSVARSAGLMWPFAMLGVALMRLKPSQAAVAISCAFVLESAWTAAASPFPYDVKVGLYAVLPFVIVALVRRYAVDSFAMFAQSDSRANLQVTSPGSFLPFTHTLFITIIVFHAASGFSLSFGSVASMPQNPLVSFVPLAVVALLVIRFCRVAVDRLYQVATLLILTGLLCILALNAGLIGGGVPWAQAFLTAGSECFSLLTWYMVTRLAARNALGALPMLLFLFTAQIIGTVAGAAYGHVTNAAMAQYPSQAVALVLLTVLLFVAYNLVVLKPFSFEATLTHVVPMSNVFIAAGPATLEENCRKVVREYNLTPREAEIVELLARGRNSQAIQEKLVVSRNTVKTHVKNIYAKLGVHSQQELIDVVERA